MQFQSILIQKTKTGAKQSRRKKNWNNYQFKLTIVCNEKRNEQSQSGFIICSQVQGNRTQKKKETSTNQ